MTDAISPVDLRPAVARLADVAASVGDEQLDLPTPCPRYTVRDLLAHIDGLALAFTLAATKDVPDDAGAPPAGPVPLDDGWRTRIRERLTALGEAWQDPAAWDGMTRAGGIDMPGQIAGLVAIDEVVVHGWDLAKAVGAPFEPDEAAIGAAAAFAAMFTDENRGDAFAPPVPVSPDAPALDHLIGAVGRDPAWSA